MRMIDDSDRDHKKTIFFFERIERNTRRGTQTKCLPENTFSFVPTEITTANWLDFPENFRKPVIESRALRALWSLYIFFKVRYYFNGSVIKHASRSEILRFTISRRPGPDDAPKSCTKLAAFWQLLWKASKNLFPFYLDPIRLKYLWGTRSRPWKVSQFRGGVRIHRWNISKSLPSGSRAT